MADEERNPLDGVDLVEIYAAKNMVEADRIVRILEDEGYEAIYRETTMSSFPSPSEAHFLVLVTGDRAADAKKLLTDLRNDGVITTDGDLL